MAVSPARHSRRWALFALGLTLGLLGAAVAPGAQASAKAPAHTVTMIRLGMTGMVTPSSPGGTWTLHARPGQELDFLAGFVPGLDELDAKPVLSVRVSMDSDHLPGGTHATVLQTKKPFALTVHGAGRYPLRWSVEFLLGHGHKTSVEATRAFTAAILVDATSPVGRTGSISPGDARATVITASNPPAVSPHGTPGPRQVPRAVGTGALPPSAAPPTYTLPPDTGRARHANPQAVAPLPLAAAADTYVFSAVVGTFVIGFLWLLWVASIKPILGR